MSVQMPKSMKWQGENDTCMSWQGMAWLGLAWLEDGNRTGVAGR